MARRRKAVAPDNLRTFTNSSQGLRLPLRPLARLQHYAVDAIPVGKLLGSRLAVAINIIAKFCQCTQTIGEVPPSTFRNTIRKFWLSAILKVL